MLCFTNSCTIQDSRRGSNSIGTSNDPSVQKIAVDRSQFFDAPKGTVKGDFIIVDFDQLAKATKSRRLHNFLNIGELSQELPITKSTIPQYVPRKSRNEIKVLAPDDKKLLAKISKKSSKKGKIIVPKANRTKSPSTVRSPGSVKDEISESETETETSDDDSEYESSDDEEVAPLPSSRPSAPLEAVKYDTIKAVWRPSRRSPDPDQIRNGLKDFWEVIRTIRDRWKMDSAAVKTAEEAKKPSEIPLLKDRVKNQRDMFEISLKTALEHGHPGILKLFGENVAFLFVAYQFLADRLKDKDVNGELATATLQLLSHCTTITTESLEKTNLLKALKVYTNKADEKRQAFTKKIIADAETYSKTKAISAKDEKAAKEKEVKVKPEPGTRISTDPVSGVKRPRPNEVVTAQAPKRIASGTTSITSRNVPAVKGGLLAKAPVAAAGGPKVGGIAAGNTVAKPKGHQIIAKPNNFIAGLTSASKKSSVQSPTPAQTKTITEKKALAPPVSGAAAKPAFSFADTLASITNPKEPEKKAQPVDSRPLETEEERKKRLRKEERRKLRVTFKPDHQLVSVRLFTHDPEEEIGHDASQVRDVGDVGGEGRMFKQHKEMMDLDDDDDTPREEEFFNYKTPSSIDFTTVDKEERDRNYEPYGGGVKKPDQTESRVREQHDASTLMVFYATSADIPPSPREPSDQQSGEPSHPLVPFGIPPEYVLQRAARFGGPSQANPAPYPTPSATPDVSAILSMLNGGGQPAQPAPVVQPQAPPIDLERIFASFSNPPQTQQQSYPQPPREAMAAMVPQSQATPSVDLQAILDGLRTAQAQPPAQQQPQAPAFQAAPNMANLGAILAQIQQPNTAPLPQLFNYQNAYGTPQQVYEDPERKRFRENGDQDDYNGSFKKQKKGGFAPRKWVLPCRFWKVGKCTKGDECTYLHEGATQNQH
ncbi:hypothetical protein M501DRAFT_670638 [Patellaria atrata CBS 101060]|uniref:C3H1-type domain-containing protein n=1 Tax=Patellaria atrata CBS 101060 TaxID=1346257 RepID=A0A9P4VSM4_9PEZI|nr:hypothetical protein M501DRAFT_670638 [Patellaria atrata CBS 101060]